MGKVKVHRSSPSLDMTPMVDLAFLLVTFFMLTTIFTAKEPIEVDTPSSTSDIKLPNSDIITISITKEGTVFFNMDNKFTKQKLIRDIGERYGISFTDEEVNTFALLPSFGVPIRSLKSFLDLPMEERDHIEQPGIPCDSLNNELKDWINFTRVNRRGMRIAIKGDTDAQYPAVQKVVSTLVDNKVTRFNLITNQENGPSAEVK
jgi:biopolymer transport protein ExbD